MVQREKRYQRNPNFIYRKIVDEVVLIPIHQNLADMDCIYSLNGVGAFIWEQLENPTTKAELQSAMLAEYDADPEILNNDLDKFLSEMIINGAVGEE